MKVPSNFRVALFSVGALAVSTLHVWSAQDTNQSSEIKFGEATNGFRGEIELVSVQGRLKEIVVWANRPADTNFAQSDDDSYLNNNSGYYMATNTFCGPIELRDSAGHILPSHKLDPASLTNYHGMEFPLEPDVSSLTAYPATYDAKMEYYRYFGRFNWYSGPRIFPWPLFSLRSDLVRFEVRGYYKPNEPILIPQLYERRFQLEDYFDIKKPGNYQLTVWPKIYQRASTNDDLCRRIDLPPVTVTIKWAGVPSK